MALRRMAMTVDRMLKDALDSYIQRDVALAEDVRDRDLEVDQMYNALFREFLTYMMEDPRNITACMHLHFIAKNIERMGDHATAIAEQVIYLVTGELPERGTPKGDGVVRTPEGRVTMARRQTPCVLIVEDEGAQREVLKYNLEAEGFDVVMAENGDEAMLLVAEEEPDLIVLDWMLPNVSGIEICRRIKADPPPAHPHRHAVGARRRGRPRARPGNRRR
jgi:hypothetical protein